MWLKLETVTPTFGVLLVIQAFDAFPRRDYNVGEGPEAFVLEVAREEALALPQDFQARQLVPETDIVAFDIVLVMDKFTAADVLREVRLYAHSSQAACSLNFTAQRSLLRHGWDSYACMQICLVGLVDIWVQSFSDVTPVCKEALLKLHAMVCQVSVFDSINSQGGYSRRVRRLGEFHPTMAAATATDAQDLDDPLYGNSQDDAEKARQQPLRLYA